ncbi:hypothetical protein AAG584_16915 [Vreelandella titanicae]|uniref:hypothetical protein n=1 Tax=Halomonadaceae TaxID=28256 RepID=UPI000483B714|nr:MULTISPECIES: hypothetical protein [unclassified Halomonas]NAO96038.1 hypothetical protein [Halomonas sp. MG34]PKH60258.1 hypothetical protein CXF94_15950 [Halomonas sp. Choline-3u-9]QGQ69398.1 hypothetical protein FDY98_03335 [Halomonas sp. PA16-9]
MLLKKYISFLNQIEQGIHPLKKYKDGEFEEQERKAYENDTALIKLLETEELIKSEGKAYSSEDKLFVTPKGAVALFEWENNVKEKTFMYKFKSSFVHLFWLIVGAALTFVVRANT